VTGHIEEADKIMVRYEAFHGFKTPNVLPYPGYPVPGPYEDMLVKEWKLWSWEYAESVFLDQHWKLRRLIGIDT
jgi:hypothetical protein